MPLIRPSTSFALLLFFAAAVAMSAQEPAGKITSMSIMELNTTAEAGRWVSVEAYVWTWRYKAKHLELRLNSRERWSTAIISVEDAAQIPRTLHGAKVRITGQTTGQRSSYNALRAPSLQHLEFLKQGGEGLFDLPAVTVEDVARHRIEWGRRVTVRGTLCARHGPADLLISESGFGLTCNLTMGWTEKFGSSDIAGGTTEIPEMSPGDVVEVTGSLVETGQDGSVLPYELSFCHVRVVGKGKVPEPLPVPVSHLANFKEYSQWVSVEGTVDAWISDGANMSLGLLDPHTRALLTVRDTAKMPFPENLFGARVRLTGMTLAMLPGSTYSLFIPSAQHFQVLRPGTKDAFEAPQRPIEDVVRQTVPPVERVKVRGVLIARPVPQVLHVRGEDAAISVKLTHPWNRSSNPAARYADGGLWPEKLEIGDEVEIVGHPLPEIDDADYQPHDLVFATVRVLKDGKGTPAPRQAALDDIISGSFTSDLVETRGRLLSFDQIPIEKGYWRTSLQLESDAGVPFHAVSYSPRPSSEKNLRVDDEVLLRALVGRATSQSPRQLWFASAAADVKSLGVSPVVLTRQLWRWGGGGAAILVLLLAWIGLLRRSNQQKTRLATELKAATDLLEHRVAERTAELRQAHEELNEALSQERELGELKSRFVTMVSHEFRTPLGVTMSAVEIMRQFDERLSPEKRRELCDEIYASTCNMAGLMEQVLLLGRVEAGKLGFKPATIDLEDILRRLIDETQSVTHRKCPIRLDVAGDVSHAKGDEALLRHIFTNLISNGVKYSPEAQPVEIRLRRDGADAVIEIADKGIGIPAQDLLNLFEAFHRGGNVGNIPGTGLGMTIVKRCVELHRGLISVKSEVGRGTTFTVRLPLFPSPSSTTVI